MSAIIKEIKGNIMGTTSIVMKLKGMRKFQSFIVYPVNSNDIDRIIIQSDTRIGYLYTKTGLMTITKSFPNGAYAPHLAMEELKEYTLSSEQLKELKTAINGTSGKSVGSSFVKCDNSGAKYV
jgi:hypothetical protein